MKRNILNKLAIACCLLAMVSCAAKKKLVSNTAADSAKSDMPVVASHPPRTVSTVPVNAAKMLAIKGQQLTFNTFSAKASAKLNINGDNKDVTINIRINRDKEIWVSISATLILTIEVARAVITPDSIKIINKLEGTYIKKPFSYVYPYSNDQINYKMLESIFVGNAIPEILTDNNASFLKENEGTTLSGSLQDMVYKLMLNAGMRVTQQNLSNHNQGQSLQVIYSNFTQQGSRLVPSQLNIQSGSQNDKIQCDLHYTKIDFDQVLQYPFSIPDSYKPLDGN